jgi:hypothetical protein
MLVYFDVGMPEKAISIARKRPRVIPMEEEEIQHSVVWLDGNVSGVCNILRAVVLRMCGYVSMKMDRDSNCEFVFFVCVWRSDTYEWRGGWEFRGVL